MDLEASPKCPHDRALIWLWWPCVLQRFRQPKAGCPGPFLWLLSWPKQKVSLSAKRKKHCSAMSHRTNYSTSAEGKTRWRNNIPTFDEKSKRSHWSPQKEAGTYGQSNDIGRWKRTVLSIMWQFSRRETSIRWILMPCAMPFFRAIRYGNSDSGRSGSSHKEPLSPG
jgi:hypothetical protein